MTGVGRLPARRAWADVANSDEDSRESTVAPVVVDDSYREAPVAGLENSKTGLNQLLTESTEISPKDFNFLFDGGGGDKARSSSLCAPWQTQQLSASAPEFIPTLSMKCPIVGVCHVIPEDGPGSSCPTAEPRISSSPGAACERGSSSGGIGDFGRTEGDAASSSSSSTAATTTPLTTAAKHGGETFTEGLPPFFLSSGRAANQEVFQLVTPEKNTFSHHGARLEGAASFPMLPPATTPKNHKTRVHKRRPSAVQVPPKKRQKSVDRAGDRSSEQQQQNSDEQLPDASEEDWQRRIELRQKAVEIGRDTIEYQRFAEFRPREDRTPEEPMTPNPEDRLISKRRWKYDVQQWRLMLKQWHVAEGFGSVAGSDGDRWQTESNFTETTEAELAAELEGC